MRVGSNHIGVRATRVAAVIEWMPGTPFEVIDKRPASALQQPIYPDPRERIIGHFASPDLHGSPKLCLT